MIFWLLLCSCLTSAVATDTTESMFVRKFRSVDDIPDSYFKQRRYIYAFVERIIDGDTMRVRHLPGHGVNPFQWKPQPLQQRGISQDTLSVRIYGVDTPELGKNKRQVSQPYAEEARDLTSHLVFHKVVKIIFLRRDQYKRAVAVVQTVPSTLCRLVPFCGPKDVSMELASAGLAELYTGGGAEYDGKREEMERRIDRARRHRKGVWSLGHKRQSAADFKKNGKRSALPESAPKAPASTKKQKGGDWLEAAVTGLELTA